MSKSMKVRKSIYKISVSLIIAKGYLHIWKEYNLLQAVTLPAEKNSFYYNEEKTKNGNF